MQRQSSPPDDVLQVVKVRGFRVDLDGLEAILAKCPHVTAPSLNEVSLTKSSSFHAQGMFVGSLVRVYMFAGVRRILDSLAKRRAGMRMRRMPKSELILIPLKPIVF